MKARFMYLTAICLAVLAIAGCTDVNLGEDYNSSEVDAKILSEIRKEYPIPEGAEIISHVGDYVSYKSTLSIEEIKQYYVYEYGKEGITEYTAKEYNTQSELSFQKAKKGKDVSIKITDKNTYRKVVLDAE